MTKLRAAGAMGRLESAFEAALIAAPCFLLTVAHTLLDANFPASLRDDLAARTGLALESGTPIPIASPGGRARRGPAFRDAVLVAHEYRCAMCGFDGWLAGEAVGLEAAHVRWWNIGAPDTVETSWRCARCTTGCSIAACWAWEGTARSWCPSSSSGGRCRRRPRFSSWRVRRCCRRRRGRLE